MEKSLIVFWPLVLLVTLLYLVSILYASVVTLIWCVLVLLGNNLYALIPIVVNFGETPPQPDRLGLRYGNKPEDLLRQREEKKIFQSK